MAEYPSDDNQMNHLSDSILSSSSNYLTPERLDVIPIMLAVGCQYM